MMRERDNVIVMSTAGILPHLNLIKAMRPVKKGRFK